MRNFIIFFLFFVAIVSFVLGRIPYGSGGSNLYPPSIAYLNPQHTVIIYNPGTTDSTKKQPCTNRLPDALRTISVTNLKIIHLCSEATEGFHLGVPGRYIYKRLKEVELTLDAILEKGIAADRIFLAGFSAGGWVSLMAHNKFPHKFNSSIAFAPAFAGKRSERKSEHSWWSRARSGQIDELIKTKSISALIFTYVDDPFESPEDLAFLSKTFPSSVKIIEMTCDSKSPHLSPFNDCDTKESLSLIESFIHKMSVTNDRLNVKK
jgi:pimeloyl-ACP methyl ester carboxylesterase